MTRAPGGPGHRTGTKRLGPCQENLSAANVSYEFLNANGSETNPYVLLTRCPVHGHVGLSDGSVQEGSGLGRTFTITIKDGKQIFTPLNPPPNAASFE